MSRFNVSTTVEKGGPNGYQKSTAYYEKEGATLQDVQGDVWASLMKYHQPSNGWHGHNMTVSQTLYRWPPGEPEVDRLDCGT